MVFVVLKPFWHRLLSIWKTHLRPSFKFLTDVTSMYPHNFPFLMPSILGSAPVPPAAKYPTNMTLPPPCFTIGMVFLGLHNDGHYGQTVLFLFHQTRGHFSKKYDLCPHVQLQTVVWLFYGGSGAAASALLSSLSGYKTRFTVDIDTFVPVSSNIFTRSFAVVLGLICVHL